MSTTVSSNFDVARTAIEALQAYDPAKAASLTTDLNKDPERALEIIGIAERYARLVGSHQTTLVGVNRFNSPKTAAESQLYRMALDPKGGDRRATDVTQATQLLENLGVAHV